MNLEDDKPRARFPNKKVSSIVQLKTFIYQKSVPLVGVMSPSTEKLYRNTRLPVVTAFMHIDKLKNPKEFAYVKNKVRKVALAWRGKIVFNIASISEYRREMDQKYDIAEAYGNKAILVGLRDGSVYYSMEGDFSLDKLREFAQQYADGVLEGNEQVNTWSVVCVVTCLFYFFLNYLQYC